jgi:hypothetical protein
MLDKLDSESCPVCDSILNDRQECNSHSCFYGKLEDKK